MTRTNSAYNLSSGHPSTSLRVTQRLRVTVQPLRVTAIARIRFRINAQ